MFDLTIESRIARLTLNRPDARNAIRHAGWADLASRMAQADGARVLIVSGTGPAFCAGADLSDLVRLVGDAEAAGAFRRTMRAGLDALRDLPIPTIAAVDGGCFGAGVALALACDIRLAGEGARFAVPPVKLGITYPAEDVARLVALIGAGQAARLFFSGAAVDAAEAARIGLVEQAVDHAGAAAETMARAIAAHAPTSLRGLKTLIGRAGSPADADGDALFDESFAGTDFAEGVAALRGKRAPDFA